MKNKLFLAFVALVCMAARGYAQVLAPGPVNPDKFWLTGCANGIGNYISGLNTAMIDFQGTSGPNPIPPGSLIVTAYEGNGTAGGVAFKDVVSGFTIHIPFCPPPGMPPASPYITSPDIIVGNDLTNPLTDYNVAVAYVDAFTFMPTVRQYKVAYTGPGAFTVGFTGGTVFPSTGSRSIHLDVIADYGNTIPTGMPWCDYYVVTWDDALGSYASLQSLNTLMPPAVVTLGTSGSGGLPYQPDVAAILRAKTWPCGGPCIPEIIGCFVTNEGNQLVYQEYNWSSLTATIPTAISPATMLPNRPRIDAPDDYNNNNPGIPNLCYYKVVSEDYGLGFLQSLAYDNMSFGVPLDDGWYYPTAGGPGAGPFSPTVAFGGNGGTQYQVAHFVDAVLGAGGPTTNVYMEPLSATWPASTIAPDITFGSPFYYRVNTATPIFCNGVYLNSISTSCNNPIARTLVAWADNDPSIPIANIKYKITIFSPPIGYTFRPANTGGGTTLPSQWRLYPDPAATQLTIEAPGAATYAATDVLGRCVLGGALAPGRQTITLTGLVPGNYVLTIQNNDGSKEHMSFVKQ